MAGKSRWAGLPPLTYVFGAALVLAGVAVMLIIGRQLLYVFCLTFLGALIAAILNYPISFLARFMWRGFATLLVLLAVLGTLGGFVALAAPAIADQASKLTEQAPGAIDKAERMFKRVVNRAPIEDLAEPAEIESTLRTRLKEEAGGVASALLPVATGFFSALSALLLLIVVGFFLAWEPEAYADGLVKLVPKHLEGDMRDWLAVLGHTVQRWMLATLLSMTFVGTVTAIGLLVLGVRAWLVLGIVNFFAEFVPFIGPFAGAVPGIALGFAQGTTTGLGALGVYFGVQQLEAYLVQPLIMKKQVKLNPVVLILWTVLMGSAFGILGILVATPLLACLKVTIDFWYVERTLGKAIASPSPA